MKALLIWDIENISYKFKNDIFSRLNQIPEKQYVVSKKKLSDKIKSELIKNNIKIFNADNQKTADDKILEILKISLLNIEEIIIISSDSDFVNFVIKHAREKKFHLIMHNNNSKRILMKSDLTNSNIKYSTFGNNNNNNKNKKNKKKNIFYHKKIGSPYKKEKFNINLNKNGFLRDLEEIRKKYKSDKNEPITKNKSINKSKKQLFKIKDMKELKLNKKKYDLKINGEKYYINFEEWFILQEKRLKIKLINDFNKIDKCSICQNKDKVIQKNIGKICFCKKCDLEWLQDLEYGNLKNFGKTHEERVLFFYYKKIFEFLLNKKINYYYDENFNEVEYELNKINIPHCFISFKKIKEDFNSTVDFYIEEDEEKTNIFADILN